MRAGELGSRTDASGSQVDTGDPSPSTEERPDMLTEREIDLALQRSVDPTAEMLRMLEEKGIERADEFSFTAEELRVFEEEAELDPLAAEMLRIMEEEEGGDKAGESPEPKADPEELDPLAAEMLRMMEEEDDGEADGSLESEADPEELDPLSG